VSTSGSMLEPKEKYHRSPFSAATSPVSLCLPMGTPALDNRHSVVISNLPSPCHCAFEKLQRPGKTRKSTQQEVLSHQVKQSFDSSIYTVRHSLDWSETQSIVSTKDTCKNHKVNASFSGGASPTSLKSICCLGGLQEDWQESERIQYQGTGDPQPRKLCRHSQSSCHAAT